MDEQYEIRRCLKSRLRAAWAAQDIHQGRDGEMTDRLAEKLACLVADLVARKRMDSVNPKMLEAMDLRFGQGWSWDRVAKDLNISRRTAIEHCSRALASVVNNVPPALTAEILYWHSLGKEPDGTNCRLIGEWKRDLNGELVYCHCGSPIFWDWEAKVWYCLDKEHLIE